MGEEFRATIEERSFDIVSFDKAVQKYLIDGSVVELDVTDYFHGFFFPPRIYINANRTNRFAAVTLYHEYQHSHLGGDEIEAYRLTEQFATQMGWPETGPGFRGEDGQPDVGAITSWYYSRKAPGQEIGSASMLNQRIRLPRKVGIVVQPPNPALH